MAQQQRKNASDRADGWLGELTRQAESQQDEQLACTSRTGRRACDLGLLPISLGDYVQLLRMTIQLWKCGERRVVPRDLEAMLRASGDPRGRVVGDARELREGLLSCGRIAVVAGGGGPADGGEAPERHGRVPTRVRVARKRHPMIT